MTRLEKVILIAKYHRTQAIFNKLLITKREQDLEAQIKDLKELLGTVRNKLDYHADWGGGGNWITDIIETTEQALNK